MAGFAALVLLGAMVVLSCAVALRFEISGFGRPTDTPLRVPYVAALGLGVLAGVLVPVAAAWLALRPRHTGSRRQSTRGARHLR